jgi:hypothetical protein
MKTLKKLSINPEKVIKNEELVNLRGGYYGEELASVYCYKGADYLGCSSTPYCPGNPLILCSSEATTAHCIQNGGNCML